MLTPHATPLFFYFYVVDFNFMLLCPSLFKRGDFGQLSSTCAKPADTSKSSACRDSLDGPRWRFVDH